MNAGLKDIHDGLKLNHIFLYLGWEDVKQRYVRTLLGPFWIVITTLVWILAMSVVMGSLFNKKITEFLPFIAAGTLAWTFVTNAINDSCNIFVSSEAIIKNIKIPYSIHICRFVTRNIIIFLHNFIVIMPIILIMNPASFNYNMILAIPAFFLFILSAFWVGTIISILNTRYRDTQPMIAASMTILPFVTPIFWDRVSLTKHAWIATFNPFYHIVEILRAPLLGQQANIDSWLIVSVITALGMVLAAYLYNANLQRIIFWV